MSRRSSRSPLRMSGRLRDTPAAADTQSRNGGPDSRSRDIHDRSGLETSASAGGVLTGEDGERECPPESMQTRNLVPHSPAGVMSVHPRRCEGGPESQLSTAAASDADWAESGAADALDFAEWTAHNAQLAVLDAIDARTYADELASAARS